MIGNPLRLDRQLVMRRWRPAIRLFTWTWLFHDLPAARAWRDEGFRVRFLPASTSTATSPYGISRRPISTAITTPRTLAGLVMAGLFFGDVGDAARWQAMGWSRDCEDEIIRQVFSDGVDFEASVPYHRLVFELFLWPALFRQVRGGTCLRWLSPSGCERWRALPRPIRGATGQARLWGDADDARALPFGGQQLADHRYLCP